MRPDQIPSLLPRTSALLLLLGAMLGFDGAGCAGRPPKPCTALAQLGALPVPEGPTERSCEVRLNPRGREELVGPYEIRKPGGLKIATGQFVDGNPYGRWVLFDEQGKPKGHFDYASPAPLGRTDEKPDLSVLPSESRLVPKNPLPRPIRRSDLIFSGSGGDARPLSRPSPSQKD